MARPSTTAAVLLAGLVACATACKGSSDPAPGGAADGGAAAVEDTDVGGTRPVSFFHVPTGYDASKPAPLVVLLHGYGASGQLQDAIFRLQSIADEEGFFLVAPDGTTDGTGKRFWNATDTCCDFEQTKLDDVAFLTGVVAEIEKRYTIDPKRRFVVGHSNGGAMAFRLACDASDRFAAVVSLAGPFYSDAALCKPSGPISVQHMHGTKDMIVPFEGGRTATVHPNVSGVAPAAPAIAAQWAAHNGCTPAPVVDPDLDVDGAVAGAETKVSHFAGCKPGGDVVLWTMEGTDHVPGNLVKDFPRMVYGFLKSHPKP